MMKSVSNTVIKDFCSQIQQSHNIAINQKRYIFTEGLLETCTFIGKKDKSKMKRLIASYRIKEMLIFP